MMFGATGHFCPFCGKPHAETWAFCQFCGQPLPSGHRTTPEGSDTGVEAGRKTGAGGGGAASAYWLQAQEHFRRGEYGRAEQCLDELITGAADSPEDLALWGLACVRLCRLDKARDLLERAIAMAPASPFVRLRMAEYWLAIGIPSRAQEELRIAASLAWDDPQLYAAIRDVASKVQRASRWSFVRAPTLPSLSGLSSLLKAPRARSSPA